MQTKDKKEIVLREINNLRKDVFRDNVINRIHEFSDDNLKMSIELKVEAKQCVN